MRISVVELVPLSSTHRSHYYGHIASEAYQAFQRILVAR